MRSRGGLPGPLFLAALVIALLPGCGGKPSEGGAERHGRTRGAGGNHGGQGGHQGGPEAGDPGGGAAVPIEVTRVVRRSISSYIE